MSNYKILTNTDYGIDYLKQIGKGAYGEVYLGCNFKTQELIAAKIINKDFVNKLPNKQFIEREISFLARKDIKHENILNCLDAYQDEKNYILITEYCENGDLKELIKKKGCLSEEEAIDVFSQIINGYSFLRSVNIIHRDLKPENIFISKEIFKIGDFGTARELSDNDARTFFIGSLDYMSPEMLESNGQYNDKTDIWSLGIIFYYMLFGKVPWTSRRQIKLIQEINEKLKNSESIIPADHYISPECKDLLLKMLEKDPDQRISIDEISVHPLFNASQSTTASDQSLSQVEESKSPDSNNVLKEKLNFFNFPGIKKVLETLEEPQMQSIIIKTKELSPSTNQNKGLNEYIPKYNISKDKKMTAPQIDMVQSMIVKEKENEITGEAEELKEIEPIKYNKIKIFRDDNIPKFNCEETCCIADIDRVSKSVISISPINKNKLSPQESKSKVKILGVSDVEHDVPNLNLDMVTSMVEDIEKRNKFRQELDTEITFDSKLIIHIEDIITEMRSFAIKLNIPKDSFSMFTFALAKLCFIKYKYDIEPIIEKKQKPAKLSHINDKVWDKLVMTCDFTRLVKKVKESLKDQNKLFYQYYNVIKGEYMQKKIKLSSFMEILNDSSDNIEKLRAFIKTMGKNIVEYCRTKLINLSVTSATREMRFIVKIIFCICDLYKPKLEIFDIALRNQQIESLSLNDINSIIANFQ